MNALCAPQDVLKTAIQGAIVLTIVDSLGGMAPQQWLEVRQPRRPPLPAPYALQ